MLVPDAEGGSRRWEGEEGSGPKKWSTRRKTLAWGLGIMITPFVLTGGLKLTAKTPDFAMRMPDSFLESSDSKPDARIFKGPADEIGRIDCGGQPIAPTHSAAAQVYLALHANPPKVLSIEQGRAEVMCGAPISRAVVWDPSIHPQQ